MCVCVCVCVRLCVCLCVCVRARDSVCLVLNRILLAVAHFLACVHPLGLLHARLIGAAWLGTSMNGASSTQRPPMQPFAHLQAATPSARVAAALAPPRPSARTDAKRRAAATPTLLWPSCSSALLLVRSRACVIVCVCMCMSVYVCLCLCIRCV